MPSEWAYAIARDQRRDVETMAANLDAARIEGLEEAFALATGHCEHGEFTHMGRYECIDALCVAIRARIEEVKKDGKCWAKKAAHLATILDAQSVQGQSTRILADALDAARIEGLEEAAKICEERGNDMDHQASLIGSISVASWGANQCHTAIRRRIEEVKA